MKKTLFIAAMALSGWMAHAGESTTEPTTEVTPATTTTTEVTEPTDDGSYYERRFSSITEAGSVIAYKKAYFNIYQAIGVRVNPYFFIGQGVGLQVSDKNMYQFQTTVDMRAYVLDRKVTPMFTVQAGLNKVGNAPYDEKKKLNDTQFTMNAGTGILIKARENASFTINGGYTLFTDFKNNVNGGYVKIGYVF